MTSEVYKNARGIIDLVGGILRGSSQYHHLEYLKTFQSFTPERLQKAVDLGFIERSQERDIEVVSPLSHQKYLDFENKVTHLENMLRKLGSAWETLKTVATNYPSSGGHELEEASINYAKKMDANEQAQNDLRDILE